MNNGINKSAGPSFQHPALEVNTDALNLQMLTNINQISTEASTLLADYRTAQQTHDFSGFSIEEISYKLYNLFSNLSIYQFHSPELEEWIKEHVPSKYHDTIGSLTINQLYQILPESEIPRLQDLAANAWQTNPLLTASIVGTAFGCSIATIYFSGTDFLEDVGWAPKITIPLIQNFMTSEIALQSSSEFSKFNILMSNSFMLHNNLVARTETSITDQGVATIGSGFVLSPLQFLSLRTDYRREMIMPKEGQPPQNRINLQLDYAFPSNLRISMGQGFDFSDQSFLTTDTYARLGYSHQNNLQSFIEGRFQYNIGLENVAIKSGVSLHEKVFDLDVYVQGDTNTPLRNSIEIGVDVSIQLGHQHSRQRTTHAEREATEHITVSMRSVERAITTQNGLPGAIQQLELYCYHQYPQHPMAIDAKLLLGRARLELAKTYERQSLHSSPHILALYGRWLHEIQELVDSLEPHDHRYEQAQEIMIATEQLLS